MIEKVNDSSYDLAYIESFALFQKYVIQSESTENCAKRLCSYCSYLRCTQDKIILFHSDQDNWIKRLSEFGVEDVASVQIQTAC